jgi:hypothetical protein
MARLNERHKPEFPPIFPEGFHRVTMDDLRKHCVDGFPDSQRRGMIMDGLERMIAKLLSVGLDECELWVNGSFLTKKPEPDDVDFVIFAPSKFWDSGTEAQAQTLEWLEDRKQREAIRKDFHCDSHAYPIYPANSSLNVFTLAGQAQWKQDFGRALISREPKGIAVFVLAQPKPEPQKAGA